MNRREVYKFFNIKDPIDGNFISEDEVDDHFLRTMEGWNTDQGSFALRMMSKYKRTYHENFKKKILNYISMALLDPNVVEQPPAISEQGPLILLDSIFDNSFSEDSLIFYDALEEMACLLDETTAKCIIIPLIYECSRKVTTFFIYEVNHQIYFDTIKAFLTIKEVLNWFQEEFIWGLKDTNLRMDTSKFHRAFQYDTNIPCFLDGLIDIYLYPKGELFEPVDIFLKSKPRASYHDSMTLTLKGFEIHSTKLYDLVVRLVKSSAAAKENFMKYVLMVIRKNLDRNKTVFDHNAVISDGYAYNMNTLLLFFSTRIIRGNLSNLIDLDFFKQVDLKSIEEEKDQTQSENQNSGESDENAGSEHNDQETTPHSVEYNNSVTQQEIVDFPRDENLPVLIVKNTLFENIQADRKLSFSTVIFITKIIFANFSYVKFQDMICHLENASMSLQTFREQFTNDRRFISQAEMIDSKLQGLTFHIAIASFKENEIPFIDFMIKFALEKGVEKFPSIYHDVILKIKSLVLRYCDQFISPNLIEYMEKMFSMQQKNLHFQSDLLKILMTDGIYLTKTLFDHIIVFYSDLNQHPEFTSEKYNLRYEIHEILLMDSSQMLRDLQPTQENLRFVNYMIDDFQTCLNDGLDSISQIKNLSSELENCKNKIEIRKLKRKLRRAKSRAKDNFAFVQTSYNILFLLLKETEILLRQEVVKKFISILNCNLRTIAGPKCSNLVIRNPEAYGFRPKEFLRNILKIYLEMKEQKYLETIVSDFSYFNIQLFMKALQIVETKSILTCTDAEDFRVFVKNLEDTQKETVEDDDIIPDEFIDPITCDTMEDPVLLKSSNVIVDRTTFDSLMLADRIDPFNREILDETKVEEATELKNKIQKYFADKKSRK